MKPKTLLCVISEFENPDVARRAIECASAHEAHIAFLLISFAPLPPPTIVYAGPMETWITEHQAGLKRLADMSAAIGDLLAAGQVSGDIATEALDDGEIASAVALRARYVDLALVFPETEANRRLHRRMLAGLLFEGGVPILLVPENRAPTLAPGVAVIAWNGTREAARALRSSLDLLAGARSVVVAMVDPIEGAFDSGEEPGADVAAYLARHGLAVDVVRLASGGNEPGAVLVRHAQDCGADLLVMGAYGHSRLREWAFGGTTRHALGHVAVPMLVCH